MLFYMKAVEREFGAIVDIAKLILVICNFQTELFHQVVITGPDKVSPNITACSSFTFDRNLTSATYKNGDGDLDYVQTSAIF